MTANGPRHERAEGQPATAGRARRCSAAPVSDRSFTFEDCRTRTWHASVVSSDVTCDDRRMRHRLSHAVLLWLAGCTPAADRQKVEIMNRIEHMIQLPVGASSLQSYARAYQFSSRTMVRATYFPAEEPFGYAFCDRIKGMGPEMSGDAAAVCPPPLGMRAGERRWFDDHVFLPGDCDGGCTQVNVEYDMTTGRITLVRCNGIG